jgi:hypothetical protein
MMGKEVYNFNLFCYHDQLSLSGPKIDASKKRAVIPTISGYYLPSQRVLHSIGCRYQLFADISNYYPSIYTHIIPWAYHGKDVAKVKANRHDLTMLGNMLDKLIQSMQEDQTAGLPIGPDTSLIISEIILTVVDMEISKLPNLKGFRFYDDFYLYFTNKQDAENALTTLNVALGKYELETNPRKTEITEIPISVDSKWKPELSLYKFRESASAQFTDIMNFFNRALEYHRLYPEERVIKYALRRIMKEKVEKENWWIYESFILQSILIEPDTLAVAVNILFTYLHNSDYTLNMGNISSAINELINYYIKLNYSNELAWTLWLCKNLTIKVEEENANALSKIEDPIGILIALDLYANGIIPDGLDESNWISFMTKEELSTENWILAYEANVKGWLSSRDGDDYIANNKFFAALRDNGVEFYDVSKTAYLLDIKFTGMEETAKEVAVPEETPYVETLFGY